MTKGKSPYLKEPNRLADVIAAVKAAAIYKFYKLDFPGWADRISGDKELADHWRKVMVEHPEFFRLDSERKKASLVWRRQHQKRFNVDTETKISKQQFDLLTEPQKDRISRMPLEPDEIKTLISTAIDLHSRAIEQKRELRWWITLTVGFFGTIITAWIASSPR